MSKIAYSSKILKIILTITAKISTANRIPPIPTNTSNVFKGYISPYPIVVVVVPTLK